MIIKQLSILSVIFMLSTGGMVAQGVITFTGGVLESEHMSLSFSAGEVVTGSFSSPSMSLFGGFSTGEGGIATSNEHVTNNLPKVFRLNQNYPNPFNPSTNIAFDLPKNADVRLEVFNSIGALVAVLADGTKQAGSHTIRFNASQFASGMYFYRLTASGNIIATKKMILIK